MNKKVIDEIFLLRSIACLSIVFLHAFARSFLEENGIVNSINMLLTFGTPTFVFISEFILARSYPDKLPSNFWGKRMKYVLLPYLLFGTFYAGSKGLELTLSSDIGFASAFLQYWWKHLLLGDFHGYFILIILQFYILHYYFHSYLKKWNPKIVLPISFLISAVYLGFFNFVPAVQTPVGQYVWDKFYWIPFVGWVFYFTLAYYCGRYYAAFMKLLKDHSKAVVIAPIVIAGMSVFLFNQGIFAKISSKQIDILFFATSMIFLIYYIGMKTRRISTFFVVISQYSFGIYLFHPLFMAVIYIALSILSVSLHPLIETVIYSVISVGLSIIASYIVNKVPYGYYFSGKIGMGRKDESREKTTAPLPTVPQSATK
ncbi:acyltransferase family protein [Anaerobacillus sp. 1_MG-2023]|uniref:acyltransferase family protein n=1 Tax=Anaerobacillus sp. 1_MG-2023 TaxID=3062655 RepID=UPI0026E32D0F|nr:acyltransferase family protein [Anaerobacillus sp. 1_MG-2023]MDO6657806.1 acyltransferase family protein [Anaerobacillus sp. 1_MG-2023]